MQKTFELSQSLSRWVKSLPLPLLRSLSILMVMSLFFIHSATFRTGEDFATRQLVWLLMGTVCLFLTVQIGYRFFISISYFLYLIFFICLFWVTFWGEVRLGAQRWIQIGSFSFQPSEFAKLGVVLALAHFLGSRNPWEGEGKAVGITALLVGMPFLLIMKQPDLGSATVFLPLAVALLLVWGIRYRYLVTTFLGGLFVSPLLWFLLKAYQKKRILVFLNPNLDPLGAGYTAIQSRIAVGSGGLFGKGWLQGSQSQLNFIPEHHTDFIFSVIGEELGFLGALFLLFLYGTLFHHAFEIIQRTTDIKGRLVATGVLSILFFQVMINMGMTFGLFPITGITLPFISYGGSSILANCIGIGLLASVYKERSIF